MWTEIALVKKIKRNLQNKKLRNTRFIQKGCHHTMVIKLDSSKNFISSDHIENSKELVNWFKSKKFTPVIIENNWEKDNQTFFF